MPAAWIAASVCGAPMLRCNRPDARRRMLQVVDVELAQRDAAWRSVHRQHFAAADEHRIAERAHRGIARRLQRNLGTDACRIADGERDPGERGGLYSTFTCASRDTPPQRSLSWRMKAAVC